MRIHPDAAIDSVHLTVASLERSVRFYQEEIGFQLHRREGATAALGAGGPDLLVLHESPGAPRARRTTGLYHFAILVPSRLDLARTLRHLAVMRTPMQGFSDHLVSEAIYLADPDGIGIEVYRDRPQAEWPRDNGQLRMATDPLDVERLLKEAEEDAGRSGAAPWTGIADGTRIGHVHLHVAFLEDTLSFYQEVIGLDLMARYGDSAVFLAAGGYHHHVGANTWMGVGAPRPPQGAIGLKHVVMRLPHADAVGEVAARVRAAGLDADIQPATIALPDPSGNNIVLTAEPAGQPSAG